MAIIIERPEELSDGFGLLMTWPVYEDGVLEHVYCDGARFHVLSWSTLGTHCSEPKCEINTERGLRGFSSIQRDGSDASSGLFLTVE